VRCVEFARAAWKWNHNGRTIVVRGYLKPISTLRRPLLTADLKTKEAVKAAYERSDVCVVPAGGVAARRWWRSNGAAAALEKFGAIRWGNAQKFRRLSKTADEF